ncbi:MAG: hypothetical protein ACYTAF_11515, partial [Planctomycetota bacterium]
MEEKLHEWGFVEVEGFWISVALHERLDRGDVLLSDGRIVAEKDAFGELAARYAQPEKEGDETAPAPEEAPAPGPEEWLAANGYRKVGDLWVPAEWAARLNDGKVMTAPGEFLSLDEL